MDAIEILLSLVVGFSVSVCLIIGFLEDKTTRTTRSADPDEEIERIVRENPDCGSNLIKEKEEIFDWDWEGIESSELEKVFGDAVVFASVNDQIHQDVKLELFGLSKIALEGPCYDPQPMSFRLSARKNWNAWRKLGDMTQEAAMHKYVDVLSQEIPGWKGEDSVSIQEPAAATSG